MAKLAMLELQGGSTILAYDGRNAFNSLNMPRILSAVPEMTPDPA